MAYATVADVQTAVGGEQVLRQLTARQGSATVDTLAVDAAIAEADAVIDTYAAKRFRVPFATPPVAIRMLSARWAGRVLRRYRSQITAENVEAEKADREWLESLAAGKVLPGVEPIPERGEIVVDKAVEREPTKVVSRRATRGYW